jgi:hypothetical protein
VIDQNERMFYFGVTALLILCVAIGYFVHIDNQRQLELEAERSRIKAVTETERPLKVWEKERTK